MVNPLSSADWSLQLRRICEADAVAMRETGAAGTAGRGPYTGLGAPCSWAPMSGPPPENPLLTFGSTEPASMALHPARSVITCGGIDAGDGPGTWKSSKQSCLDTRMALISRPDAAANDHTSG